MAAVSKELNNELKSLENLTQLKSEFKQLKEDIEPWLHVRPNLSELQDVRKQIRQLKSKLRHKMADIQDLEEVITFAFQISLLIDWVMIIIPLFKDDVKILKPQI